MDTTKLKQRALNIASVATQRGDMSVLLEKVKLAHAAGMRRDDLCELCRHVLNAAARLAFGAGLALALANELAADEEDDLAEPATESGAALH